MNGSALKFRRAVEKHPRIGFDTAPLIYFIEDVTPYADLLAPVFDRLENHRVNAATSTITLAEIFTKPLSDKNFALVDEIKVTLKTFETLAIVAIDERLAEAAALVRARYRIRLPDALQVTAAIQEGATALLSNDKRLRKVDALEVPILDDFL